MRRVIRQKDSNLYAQSWHSTDGSITRIEWVPKVNASSYNNRKEINQVLEFVWLPEDSLIVEVR